MSNSSLISYTKISPNKHSPRNHKIDTITIHCVVGQCSIEALGETFANPNRQASSNYGIGADGRIGLFCDEGDRSWCSGSAANDNRAVTIECASDAFAPYAINEKVYASLVKLCADICKRNNISALLWKNDKNLIGITDKQNITVHRWFEATECPGDYIFSRLGQIADEVNSMLAPKKTNAEMAQEVIAGKWGVDPERTKKLTEAGYNAAAIQKEVDALMGKKASTPAAEPKKPAEQAKKTNMEIAEEVVAGKWGVDPERTKKLTEAGYDAAKVQKGVNALMGISNAKETPAPAATSKEVKATGIAEKFNKNLSGTYTTKTALNMRDKPSKNSKILVVAPKGTKVQCFGYYTVSDGISWYYVVVTINSVKYTGFMDSTYFN